MGREREREPTRSDFNTYTHIVHCLVLDPLAFTAILQYCRNAAIPEVTATVSKPATGDPPGQCAINSATV